MKKVSDEEFARKALAANPTESSIPPSIIEAANKRRLVGQKRDAFIGRMLEEETDEDENDDE